MAGSNFAATWLGHATFLLQTPGGKRLLVDPWLGNPSNPEPSKPIDKVDLILVTHGHSDHITDAAPIAKRTGAPVISTHEIGHWLSQHGAPETIGMNKGGTKEAVGIHVTMVHAEHTSSAFEGDQIVYLGEPVGYVLRLENGQVAYFAGDTTVFSDMALIKELYEPSVGFLPIGDFYTMGPDAAALACRLLGLTQVVPMHHGTFPALTGTPERLRALVEPTGVKVLDVKPGETIEIPVAAR